MVKKIEIETSATPAAEKAEATAGDVPSLFGTLTSQRYHWNDIIATIAKVEGIDEYQTLQKSKRRELVQVKQLFHRIIPYISLPIQHNSIQLNPMPAMMHDL